jgi:plastocyanin
MKRNITGALLMVILLLSAACTGAKTVSVGLNPATSNVISIPAASNAPGTVTVNTSIGDAIPAVVQGNATVGNTPVYSTLAVPPTGSTAGASPQALEGTTVPTTSSAPAGENYTVRVVAEARGFDSKAITVLTSTQVKILFENKDAGAAYNLAFYIDEAAKDPIYVGQTITGPATIVYQFMSPLEPGDYFFRCDSHTASMSGRFIVFSCC